MFDGFIFIDWRYCELVCLILVVLILVYSVLLDCLGYCWVDLYSLLAWFGCCCFIWLVVNCLFGFCC